MQYITSFILVLVVVLVLVFVFRKYIVVATDVMLKILFVLCAVATITALFYVPPFRYTADKSLRGIGVYSALESTDRQLQDLNPTRAVEGLGEKISNWFNRNDNEQPPVEDDYQPGKVVTEVYPSIVNSLALIYRILTVVLGVVTMIFAVYFGYSTYGASQVLHLEHELHKLQQRVAELEEDGTVVA